MAKAPIRHPALIMEDGFLPPGMMPGEGAPMDMAALMGAGGMDPMQALSDEGNGAPGAEPKEPSQEGDGETMEGGSCTPAQIDAGVRVLEQGMGSKDPAQLVQEIYAAMDAAEKPEEGEEGLPAGNDSGNPELDMLSMLEGAA